MNYVYIIVSRLKNNAAVQEKFIYQGLFIGKRVNGSLYSWLLTHVVKSVISFVALICIQN